MPADAAPGPTLNRASYNRIAAQWNEARRAFVLREGEYLDALLASAAPGATVLDLGCGTGRPMAAYVTGQKRHVTGVDQAEALLAIAREAMPNERWIHSSMEQYDFGDEYAAAIVWDSLFHLPRALHAGILASVVGGLPTGGRLMLTVGGADHPAFTDTMFGEMFAYDSNTPPETERMLRDLGCRIVIGEFMNVPDGGRDKGRYAIVAERTATGATAWGRSPAANPRR